MNKQTSLLFSVLVLLSVTLHAGEKAHQHGVAILEVAVDGGTLRLRLESPLDNLAGFEHAPKNEAQKKTIRAMADKLNRPVTLFAPSPQAACVPVSTRIESQVLGPALLQVAGNPPAADNREKAPGPQHEDGHAELIADYEFRCAQPQHLSALEVKLFDAFPNLKQLDAKVAGPRGQKAARLTSKARQVAW